MNVCEFWVEKANFNKYIKVNDDLSIECIEDIENHDKELYKLSEELSYKEIHRYILRALIRFRVKFTSFKKSDDKYYNQLYELETKESNSFIIFRININIDDHEQIGEYFEDIKLLSRLYSTYLCYSLFTCHSRVNRVLTKIVHGSIGNYDFHPIYKIDYTNSIREQFKDNKNPIIFK